MVNSSTKRTCITCTAKGVNSNRIPLWSKKAGLYSMLPKVLNCEDKYNPQKHSLKKESPEITGTQLEIELHIKEKRQWVFYWAAEAGNQLDPEKPMDPAGSYGDESNRGVIKTDDEGDANLVLNCPRLYKVDDKLHPRHVHYTVLTKDNVWNETIGTLEIVCKIPFDIMKGVVESGNHVIMNALDEKSFTKKKIPTSILCHHEGMDGLPNKKKEELVKRMIKDNLSGFRLAKKFVDAVKDIKEVPIITYCANNECDASSKLAEHLYDAGFYNVIEYPGGTDEWFSKRKVNFFDSDDEEEEDGNELEDDDGNELEDDDGNEDEEETKGKGNLKLEDEVSDDEDEGEEIIVIDGVQYLHSLDIEDSGEVKTIDDLDVVGNYNGDYVEWLSTKYWRDHKERVDALTNGKDKGKIAKAKDNKVEDDTVEDDKIEDDKIEDDKIEDDKVEEGVKPIGTHESSSESESESSDDEYDYNESSLSSRKVVDLRGLLDKLNLNKQGKKQVLIDRLLECKPQKGGGGQTGGGGQGGQGGGQTGGGDGLLYGGGINQSVLNQQFRGWGFTFLR
jgi:rhodanese-related sulfurtransferase